MYESGEEVNGHFLGIRHHGPGSAEQVLRELEALKPDVLLVEIPADLEKELVHIGREELRPPVALLAYHPKDFSQSAFLPFAEFSPEWQAIRWANHRSVPVLAMDLPLAIHLAGKEDDPSAPPLWKESKGEGEDQQRIRQDPLGFLASLAGYTDRERWWEDTFEREAARMDTFEAVALLMRQLREATPLDSPEVLLREAHMRKIIRKAAKQGGDTMVVVCGAWHVPALEAWDRTAASSDNQLLRKRPRVKLRSSWIPWSYSRLALDSGYRAGVTSPAWYELLFADRPGSSLRWLADAARLLREEDLDASAAHVQEAVLLANTLARLRGRRTPGLQELEEAARSVYTQGQQAPLDLIRRRLIIGDRLGRVPPAMARVPLLEDLQRQVRSARLKKEQETTLPLEKALDLRKPANRKASLLLHRLLILDIPWGRLKAGREQQTGSFSEYWTLHWQPDFAIQLIQAAIWGNTVEEAATGKAIQRGRDARSMRELSQLAQEVLQADLKRALGQILQLLEDQAAYTQDVTALLEALPLLVRIWRYGNTRQTDTRLVERLLRGVLPRIFVGLPSWPQGVDDEEAGRQSRLLVEAHHALFLLEYPDFHRQWLQAVDRLAGQNRNHPLLRGMADRMVFDKGRRTIGETARNMHRQLSRFDGSAPWLEGFLYGSGQLLILQPGLWSILDRWLAELPEEDFPDILPVLRRTFAHFSRAERQKMLQMARQPEPGGNLPPAEADPLDKGRAALVAPILDELLGGS